MQKLLSFPQTEGQFPLRDDICYLNHAAVSPWPRSAKEALDAFSEENIVQGAASYPKWLKVEQSLRDKLRDLINASSSKEIALTKNTSEALSIIAYGLTWEEGDEIVISNHEFPSNRIVWESLQRFGVKLIIAHLNTDTPEQEVINNISSKTKLVSLSSVQYASGISLDLVQISNACKKQGALFCVDAIQSLGAIPFDQQAIDADFIVADGHKWMMGPEGLALFYVKQNIQNSLDLKQFGWHMVKHRGNYDLSSWEPADDATRFECGSPNMLGIHTLNASLEVLLNIGIKQIHNALLERVQLIEDRLTNLSRVSLISPRITTNDSKRSGIITFKVEGQDSAQLYKKLMDQNVICANRGGGVRLSPHFYTSETCINRAIDLIEKIIEE